MMHELIATYCALRTRLWEDRCGTVRRRARDRGTFHIGSTQHTQRGTSQFASTQHPALVLAHPRRAQRQRGGGFVPVPVLVSGSDPPRQPPPQAHRMHHVINLQLHLDS